MPAKGSKVTADKFDLRDRFAYRFITLANMLSLWASRNYSELAGVGPVEWRVMVALHGNGCETAKDIAEFSMMDKGNISRAIRKLESIGALKYRRDKCDGRRTILSMTEKGKRLYKKIRVSSDWREAELYSVLTETEKRQVTNILKKLDAKARELLVDEG